MLMIFDGVVDYFEEYFVFELGEVFVFDDVMSEFECYIIEL